MDSALSAASKVSATGSRIFFLSWAPACPHTTALASATTYLSIWRLMSLQL